MASLENGGQAPTAAVLWQLEDLLHCMICFEAFKIPKMLQCGHTFCADCLIDYMRTNHQHPQRSVTGKLQCPTCRELTSLPPDGVSGLRTDFKVQKIEDLFRTMNVCYQEQQQQQRLRSQQQQQPVSRTSSNTPSSGQETCGPCQAQSKKVTGQHFCTNCSMAYCDSCLAKHGRNSLFQSHKVVSRGTDTPYCKKHPAEQGKYYCRKCEHIVCTLCVVNDHGDHDVAEVTSVLRQQQTDVNNLRNVVQTRNNELKNRIAEIKALRQMNVSASEQTEAAIKDHGQRMVEAVKQKQAKLLDELHKTVGERLSALDRELERVKYNISKTQMTGDYASSTAALTSIKMMAVYDQLIQRMRTVADADSNSATDDAELLQSVVAFRPNRVDGAVPDLGVIEMSRVPDQRLQMMVRQSDTQPTASAAVATAVAAAAAAATAQQQQPKPIALPRTSVGSSSTNEGPAVSRAKSVIGSSSSSSTGSNNNNNGSSTGRAPKLLAHVCSYGEKAGDLKDPLSVVCLLDGSIVVSEWANKRLQVFDAKGRHVRFIAPGQIGPQGIALSLKGNVISTDVTQKRLQVFDPAGNTLSKWGLGQFFSPCGVTVSPNGNCIVSDTGDHSVSIYRGEHTCLRRFGTKGSRDDQFDNPLYVTTGVRDEIVVSDSNNHCLKIFDSSGQFLRRIGSEGSGAGQVKCPRGVCADHQGNIIVADRNNDRISMFSMSGRFLQHLLTSENGIKAPYGVGITVAGQLVVTESGNNRAALKVFQL